MLSREDFPNRVNLTLEQQKFAEQYGRRGSSKIRTGKERRRLLSLALMPLTVPLAGGHNRKVRSTELNNRPFVRGSEVAVVSLADHPARHPNDFHFIEARVLVNVGYEEGGAICIGGKAKKCSLRADFSKGPLMRGQQALQCESMGDLESPRTGKLRIAGCGKWIDVCVGQHRVGHHGNSMHNTIVYRLARTLLEGKTAAAELAFMVPALPESGEVIELDDVQAGVTLVKLSRKAQYFKAQFETGSNGEDPVLQWPPGRILPANRVDLFKVLLEMNGFQNDVTLSQGADKPPPVDPKEWAFGAFVAFEQRVEKAKDDKPEVNIDPLELTKLPGWTLAQALKDDFRNAVGPHGIFQLVAEHSGRVVSVETMTQCPHMLRINMEDGKFQLVPATAVLYRTTGTGTKPLEADDVLVAGESIGDICQRVRYASWEVLAEVLRDNLHWMVEEFLHSTSIQHGDDGWDGNEVLYDSRYVTSVLPYSARDEEGEVKWYWDIRKATQYYDKTVNAIVLPPVRYDNWEQLHVVVNGISFNLDDPFSPSVPVAAEQQTQRAMARAG